MIDPMSQPSVTELMELLGEQLRRQRIRCRLNQQDLAARAGVARSAVSRLENGAGGNIQTLVAVVRALGKLDWLNGFAPHVIDPMVLLRIQGSLGKRVRVRKDEDGNR